MCMFLAGVPGGERRVAVRRAGGRVAVRVVAVPQRQLRRVARRPVQVRVSAGVHG